MIMTARMARLMKPVTHIHLPVLVLSCPPDSIIESSNMDSLARICSTQLRHQTFPVWSRRQNSISGRVILGDLKWSRPQILHKNTRNGLADSTFSYDYARARLADRKSV